MKYEEIKEDNPHLKPYLEAGLSGKQKLNLRQLNYLQTFKSRGLSRMATPREVDPPLSPHTILLYAICEEILYSHPKSPVRGSPINLTSAISLYILAGNTQNAHALFDRARESLPKRAIARLEEIIARKSGQP